MAGPFMPHPYLTAAHQIVFSLAHNIAEVSPRKALYPLLIVILITFAAMALISRRRGAAASPRGGSAAALSAFWMLFFSYGPVEQAAVSIFPAAGGTPFLAAWLAVSFFVVIGIARSARDFTKIDVALNFAAAALVILPAYNILIFEYTSRVPARPPAAPGQLGGGRPSAGAAADDGSASSAPLPDIYHIVFDGYPRADVLSEIYGFDNSGFIKYLERKGFFVASKSYANYATFTLHSVASYLNYGHYADILKGVGPDERSLDALIGLIQRNAAARYLRARGYEFISFNTLDCVIYTADTLLKPPEFRRGALADIYSDSFYNLLINKTPLAVYYRTVSKDFDFSLSEGLRSLCAYMFSTVPAARESAGMGSKGRKPVFVYAHFPVPHPPFVFDEKGESFAGWKYFDSAFGDANLIIKNGEARANYIKFYASQVRYVNSKAVEMIDAIIKNSAAPPVIIVQSDHGPGSDFNFSDITALTPRGLFERYAILNAYYIQGRPMDAAYLKKTGLHERITPVNTYRVLFNELFGAGMELLPDECFYATDKYPYNFTGIDIK